MQIIRRIIVIVAVIFHYINPVIADDWDPHQQLIDAGLIDDEPDTKPRKCKLCEIRPTQSSVSDKILKGRAATNCSPMTVTKDMMLTDGHHRYVDLLTKKGPNHEVIVDEWRYGHAYVFESDGVDVIDIVSDFDDPNPNTIDRIKVPRPGPGNNDLPGRPGRPIRPGLPGGAASGPIGAGISTIVGHGIENHMADEAVNGGGPVTTAVCAANDLYDSTIGDKEQQAASAWMGMTGNKERQDLINNSPHPVLLPPAPWYQRPPWHWPGMAMDSFKELGH